MKSKRINKRRIPQVYCEEFGCKAVKEVLYGELTQFELKRNYNVRNNEAILYWMTKFSGIENYRENNSYLTGKGSD
ncbi:MAG: hypothetical protein CVV25_08505 [Ignavibacteriae bacterium HGW-Ignavibacteriae-4]|jgi:hypothetical protein|nr:MAG: hypothetical protein CVV25_08505 [Ignavibacteriae bacterium HGW-Ignavibacteriae-4]